MAADVQRFVMQTLLLGPSGVGKTQLTTTERLPHEKIDVKPSKGLMSSDKLPERTMSAPKGDKASLQMWATDAVGWTEGLDHLTRDHLRTYEVIFYVCRIDDAVSLKELSRYIDHTRSTLGKDWNRSCHILLVTHGDLPRSQWKLSERTLDAFAKIHRLAILRDLCVISAKDPTQVKAVFNAAFLTVYSIVQDGVVRNPGFGSFPTDRMPANGITAVLPTPSPTWTPLYKKALATRRASKHACNCTCNGPSAAGLLTRTSDAVGCEACEEGQNTDGPREAASETVRRRTSTSTPSDAPTGDLQNPSHIAYTTGTTMPCIIL